jgi:hypothetical protein
MKQFLLSFCILSSFLSFSQQIILKGKITDKKTNLPLEQATVYLTSVKDSTVAFYDLTKKNGNFEIKTTKQNKSFYLKVSYLGYDNYSQLLDKIVISKDFGTITLSETENMLGEVVLKSEIPPVRMKNDTLEFNVKSFKTRPDANVEALLKELPGVEIDAEGKITINGKPVDQILVNGKPFFDKDGKVAMQNLPSEIIEKIQIVDTKTKKEELTGQAATGKEKTINLTIDEKNNKGHFGKATAGYGTAERYESSLLFNAFKGDRRFSVLASSNNINSIGFSQDEIFDNMRTGSRSYSMYSSSDGSFGLNGMEFGGNQGITQSNMVGLNYRNKWKKLEMGGNYLYSTSDSDYISKSNSTNLLPTTTTFSENSNTRNKQSNSNVIDVNFQFNLDSLTVIYYEPKISRSINKNINQITSKTFNIDNLLLNESLSNNISENENVSFRNNLSFVKKFKKINKNSFFFGLNTANGKQNNENSINSETFFNTSAPDIRKQKQNYNSINNSIDLDSGINFKITDSISMTAKMFYKTRFNENSTNTNDFNLFANNFSNFNAALSNLYQQNTNTFGPSLSFRLNKKKINTSITVETNIIEQNNFSEYLNTVTNLNKREVLPTFNGYISYNFTDEKSIYSYFNYDYELPSAVQLLPVINLSDPLNTTTGNEFLKPSNSFNAYISFDNYSWNTRTGYYTGIDYRRTFNPIVSSTVFDADFKSTTTYINLDKSENISIYGSWSKNSKKEKREFKVGYSMNARYEYNEGIINNLKFESRATNLYNSIYFKWSIQDLLTIKPIYEIDFNNTNFKNYSIDNANFYTQSVKMELTSYVPKNLVFGNDFSYNYNSNISDGFQKDFYLLNMSLGYSFYKEKFTTKVKVYDVLNQNVGVRRTVTPTQITDSDNNVLQRYMMFSITYKLDKIGKKKEENTFFMSE